MSDSSPESAAHADADWGFESERKGLSRELKIGLFLMLILLGVLSLVIYKKLDQSNAMLASIKRAVGFDLAASNSTPKTPDDMDHADPDHAVTEDQPPPQQPEPQVDDFADGRRFGEGNSRTHPHAREVEPVRQRSRSSELAPAEFEPGTQDDAFSGGRAAARTAAASQDPFAGGFDAPPEPARSDGGARPFAVGPGNESAAFGNPQEAQADPFSPSPGTRLAGQGGASAAGSAAPFGTGRDGRGRSGTFAGAEPFERSGARPTRADEAEPFTANSEPGKVQRPEWNSPKVQTFVNERAAGAAGQPMAPFSAGGAERRGTAALERGNVWTADPRSPASPGGVAQSEPQTFEEPIRQSGPGFDSGGAGAQEDWNVPSASGQAPRERGAEGTAEFDGRRPIPDSFSSGERFEPSPTQVEAVDLFGSQETFAENDLPNDPNVQIYTIQENDSYWSISKQTYGTARYFQALARYNQRRIPDPQRMRVGMQVLLPNREKLEALYPDLFPKQSARPVVAASDKAPGYISSRFPTTSDAPAAAGLFHTPDGRPMYRVGTRETLGDIARRHLGRASRWIQIFELNRGCLQNPHDLQVGTVLRLPPDAAAVNVVPGR